MLMKLGMNLEEKYFLILGFKIADDMRSYWRVRCDTRT
jgi:hypothetical protein